MLPVCRRRLSTQALKGTRLDVADARRTAPDALLDRFGRRHTYLRVSLTERCNLRCSYCMPPQGVELKPDDELLTTPELVTAIRALVRLGVTKVRLTGGEPLVRKDIVALVEQIHSLGVSNIGVTSNGIVFARHARALKQAGLSHVNLSLDTLDASRFKQITQRDGHAKVMQALQTACALQFDSVKVNCVVQRGVNDDELAAFAALTRDEALQVRFLEFMPFGLNQWQTERVVSGAEMLQAIKAVYPGIVPCPEEDGPSPTARLFKIPGFKGRVGFITAMTDEFCSTCSRLRLTADGNLKNCLFGNHEVSLRDALRSGQGDAGVLAVVRASLEAKHERLGGYANSHAIAEHSATARPMILIGG